MTKENQPNKSENVFQRPFRQFSTARWQTKVLILGSVALIIAAA